MVRIWQRQVKDPPMPEYLPLILPVVLAQNAVIEVLAIRFNSVPAGLKEAIRVIQDESQLRELHRLSVQIESLEEFAKAI